MDKLESAHVCGGRHVHVVNTLSHALRYTALHYSCSVLCSSRGVSCGLCRVRVCIPFFVWGLSVHIVSETRTGEKSPPLAPIPKGRQCALPTHRSCADHFEPTPSLVTLWIKKRLPSCRRVRSPLVGSTVRHLGTSCVRWGACASLPFVGAHQGFLIGCPFIH